MLDLLYEEETYRLRGACFEVYTEKGPGFLESVYQESSRLNSVCGRSPLQLGPDCSSITKGNN